MVDFSAIGSGIKQAFQYPLGTYIAQKQNMTIEEAHKQYSFNHNQPIYDEDHLSVKALIHISNFIFSRSPGELISGLIGLGGIGAFVASTSPGHGYMKKLQVSWTGVMKKQDLFFSGVELLLVQLE